MFILTFIWVYWKQSTFASARETVKHIEKWKICSSETWCAQVKPSSTTTFENNNWWSSYGQGIQFSSVTLLCLILCQRLQHTRIPCPSPPPWACSNSYLLIQWCHANHLVFCHPVLLLPLIFSNESVLHIRWPNLQLQHQSFQWISRTDFLYVWLVWSPCSPRDSQESSLAKQFKSINFLVLSFLYSPTLISIHDYWKNHSFD